MKITRLMKWVRRLAEDRRDDRAHNRYLAKTNAQLTGENSQLRMSTATLRLRLDRLERAINLVGTENE